MFARFPPAPQSPFLIDILSLVIWTIFFVKVMKSYYFSAVYCCYYYYGIIQPFDNLNALQLPIFIRSLQIHPLMDNPV